MLNIEKQSLELQFEDESRRQERLSQREQRERDELYTKLREMLAGQHDERTEGRLATVPRDALPVANDADDNDFHCHVPAVDTLHVSISPAHSMSYPPRITASDVVTNLTVFCKQRWNLSANKCVETTSLCLLIATPPLGRRIVDNLLT